MMKSKFNTPLLLSTVLCLLPIVLGLIVYDKLPEQVAVHFDSTGAPNNYLPKGIAVFGLPVIFAVLNIITHFRLNHDPKNDSISIRLKQATKWALPVISVIVMPITLFLSMGAPIPIVTIVVSLVGIVIVICGNYLPKCKQNYTAGIKLPWTLHSQENWNKTHRFAGVLWVVCGLLMIANAFLSWPYVNIALLAAMVLLPPVFSYLLYKKQGTEQA
jgi:uncharacterized membrane protein